MYFSIKRTLIKLFRLVKDKVWISDFTKCKGTLAWQSELGGPEEVIQTLANCLKNLASVLSVLYRTGHTPEMTANKQQAGGQ